MVIPGDLTSGRPHTGPEYSESKSRSRGAAAIHARREEPKAVTATLSVPRWLDLLDIRVSAVKSFLQFCNAPSYEGYLGGASETPISYSWSPMARRTLPRYSSRRRLEWNPSTLPGNLHNFIDECFLPIYVRRSRCRRWTIHERKLEARIGRKEIIIKLPEWLQDLYDTFLTQPASVVYYLLMTSPGPHDLPIELLITTLFVVIIGLSYYIKDWIIILCIR